MTVGALMAAESGHHERYADTVGSALIATALYWLLHAYTRVLGYRLATGERLSTEALWQGLVKEWPIVRGAAIPLLVLVIAWVAGADRETGVNAALWSAVASLVLFELAAAVRSQATAGEFALELGVGLTMGLGLVGLRVLLH